MQQRIDGLHRLSEQIDHHFDCSEFEQGEALLRVALKKSKDIPAYHYFFQGERAGYLKLDAAEQESLFVKALSGRPNDFFLLRKTGAAVSKLGKEEEAIALFDQALALNPKDHDALHKKGVSRLKQGKEEEAIALFDQALALHPGFYHAIRGKGVAFSRLGKEEEAIVLFDQALSVNPRCSNILRNKGFSMSKLGKYEEAIAFLTKPSRSTQGTMLPYVKRACYCIDLVKQMSKASVLKKYWK